MSARTELPHRLVDREHRSWMLTQDREGRLAYTADMHQTHRSLEEVQARHGPTRSVLPITNKDRQALEAALAAAGRRAV